MELAIKYLPIDKIKPYENNPRKNDEAVKYVAESIKQFGFKNPIILDKNNVIVAGHTRLKAAEELDIKEVPCIYADDLSEEQVKAFRLADNKVAEIASWDFGKLEEELADIDIDMSEFGFKRQDLKQDTESENPYTQVVNIPQYTPSGDKYTATELYDDRKYKEILREIETAEISEDVKEFLRLSAGRHVILDFKRIAEFYSNAEKNVQELMENQALVIIDVDDAIAKGYATLKENIDGVIADEI